MKKELNLINTLCEQGLADSNLLTEYEDSCLKESEKELLLILEIRSEPTYHCLKCGEEVYPNFPSPIAYCPHCKEQQIWTKNVHLEDNITFDQLCKLTFNKAHETIQKVPLKKRITLLEDVDKHLVHCYEIVHKDYNDQGFGKSMSPEIYYRIMGKIKHLEILQNWLFGIE